MRGGLVLAVGVLAAGCGRIGFDGVDRPDASEPVIVDAEADAAGYRATAVRFETAGNDYMWAGSLQNTVSSGRGTFSAWFHFTGGDDQQQLIAVTQIVGFGGIVRQANNRFEFLMQNCLGVPMIGMATQSSYTTASGWIHVLASWDAAMGRADLYVNDVDDRAPSPTIISGAICYDTVRWGIAGWVSGALDADVADFYAALGVYIDLSVEANRRKFIDAAGKPVDLGGACDAPTGSPSSTCFTGDPATWNTNEGSAAGFNLEGDGLVKAATSPSD